MGDSETFRFGSFELLSAQRELLFKGAPIRLGLRALDVLLALARRPGQLVSSEI
jgi:DNA-binding winged helix-turn-helix (wHTH) protein